MLHDAETYGPDCIRGIGHPRPDKDRMIATCRTGVLKSMQLRGKFLAAAVPAAIVMTGLIQAPASAATHWQVLYQTPRHVKAEACRTRRLHVQRTQDPGGQVAR